MNKKRFLELLADFCEDKRFELKESSLRRYQAVGNKIFKANLDYQISRCNTKWLRRYIDFCKKQGNSENTIAREIKFLKTILYYGSRKYGYKLKLEPVKVRKKKVIRTFLTKDEVKTLLKAWRRRDFSGRERKVLQMFLFQCFTGLRFSDLQSLRWKHIINEDGELFIRKITEKTGKINTIPLGNTAWELLPPRRGRKKVFETGSLQDYNRKLKSIADKLGIKKNITSHVGRHTFATLLLNEGVPLDTVSRILGHSSFETTRIYAKLLLDTKIKTVALLDELFEDDEAQTFTFTIKMSELVESLKKEL